MSILEELEQRVSIENEQRALAAEYFPVMEQDHDYPIHDPADSGEVPLWIVIVTAITFVLAGIGVVALVAAFT